MRSSPPLNLTQSPAHRQHPRPTDGTRSSSCSASSRPRPKRARTAVSSSAGTTSPPTGPPPDRTGQSSGSSSEDHRRYGRDLTCSWRTGRTGISLWSTATRTSTRERQPRSSTGRRPRGQQGTSLGSSCKYTFPSANPEVKHARRRGRVQIPEG